MLDHSRLLQSSSQCVHFTDSCGEDHRALLENGLVVRALVWHGSPPLSLLQALGLALDFPDYFGCNWDAAEECLHDLEWLPCNGVVLLVPEAERLWAAAPRDAGALVEIWLSAAEAWTQKRVPFHLIFCWR